ncbi:MAG: glycosyltransferase family 2 protein, partial [Phenylobacterium sp.]
MNAKPDTRIEGDVARAQTRVAVLIPCFNEAVAIARTVGDFRAALPDACVYVYDNNSTDDTVAVASAAGAIVRTERRQGKGAVVRRMFADIDADVFVIADGDATYDAFSAPGMIDRLLAEQLDMVVGARESEVSAAYRPGHRFGNALLTNVVNYLFGRTFSDMLSGYRVFSRRFVKTFPTLSQGFEIETEITVHALELAMPVAEVVTPYGARPEGSASKLSTYRDGWRIVQLIMHLFRQERPVQLYGSAAA